MEQQPNLDEVFHWLSQGYVNISEGQANTFEAGSPFHQALQVLMDQADTFKAAPGLLQWLGVLLDMVDYTRGACTVTEMVGAVLPKDVIEKARAVIVIANATK